MPKKREAIVSYIWTTASLQGPLMLIPILIQVTCKDILINDNIWLQPYWPTVEKGISSMRTTCSRPLPQWFVKEAFTALPLLTW